MLDGRQKYCLLIALLISLGIGANASAKELYGPEAGVIPYGMGRAYSAVADDWHALHYNPAGLAMVEGVDLQILDLNLSTNKQAITNIKKYQELGESGDDARKMRALIGDTLHFRAANYSQITLPRFAFGTIYDYNVTFDAKNQVNPRIRIRNTKDFGFTSGFAVGIGRGANRTRALRIGTQLKYIKRTGSVQELSVAQFSASGSQALLDRFNQSGWGLGATLGLQYQLPVAGRAEYTVSFVYHDIGNTSFGSEKTANRPTPLQQNMVAGFAARFPIGGKVNRRVARRYGQPRSSHHMTVSADYTHLNIGTGTEQLPKHLRFGMNIDLPIISLQAGINQGALTGGIGVDLAAIRVNAATYSEELGSFAGQQRDRRYIISVGTGFGFSGF